MHFRYLALTAALLLGAVPSYGRTLASSLAVEKLQTKYSEQIHSLLGTKQLRSRNALAVSEVQGGSATLSLNATKLVSSHVKVGRGRADTGRIDQNKDINGSVTPEAPNSSPPNVEGSAEGDPSDVKVAAPSPATPPLSVSKHERSGEDNIPLSCEIIPNRPFSQCTIRWDFVKIVDIQINRGNCESGVLSAEDRRFFEEYVATNQSNALRMFQSIAELPMFSLLAGSVLSKMQKMGFENLDEESKAAISVYYLSRDPIGEYVFGDRFNVYYSEDCNLLEFSVEIEGEPQPYIFRRQ